MALRVMNQGSDEPSLACLIERSAELKRSLVDFALSPRMKRHLERFVVEGAGPHEVLIEDEAIDAIDRFALLYRLPNGKTVLDQFLAGWPDLIRAVQARLNRIYHPETSAAELAILLAEHYQGDPDVRLEVVDFISTSGHAAEAVELLEPRLREAPDDDFAANLYGAAIERAYATASADGSALRERAAVRRFADRTGLIALTDAVSAFLDGTELGEAVRARVTEELSVTGDLDWSPEDRAAAVDGVAGRHSAGGRDLAQHRPRGQAQPGRGRRGGRIHR